MWMKISLAFNVTAIITLKTIMLKSLRNREEIIGNNFMSKNGRQFKILDGRGNKQKLDLSRILGQSIYLSTFYGTKP